MNVFFKQAVRKPVLTGLTGLLLSLSVAVSGIGFSAWYSARAQYDAINSDYTTTAIPKEQELGDGGVIYDAVNGVLLEPPDLLDKVEEDKIPNLVQVDKRGMLGALVEGCTTLSSGALDLFNYDEGYDNYSASYCVLAVECVEIIDESQGYQETVDPVTGVITSIEYGIVSYVGKFKLVDPVVRLGCYDLPPYDDTIRFDLIENRDGSCPFEVGKTYLVRGFYQDYPVFGQTRMTPDKDKYGLGYTRRFIFTRPPLYETIEPELRTPNTEYTDLPNFTLIRSKNEKGQGYAYTPEDSQPFFTEYEGDWRDFLETAEGAVWKDEIIPVARLNHQSATVILSDNVESMYLFNTKEASILEGRYISSEEYTAGAQVCLVSAAYAELNGLEVGDTLKLDLYDSGYSTDTVSTATSFASIGAGQTVCRFPLIPETRIDVTQEYEIVGIYTGPEFSAGIHAFHADTIFVPKQSVPDAHLYEDNDLPLLTSYVLENGTTDEFEAYMESIGLGGQFLYFDQNYSKVSGALEALMLNASRMFAIGGLMLLLAAGLYLFLNARRMASAARGMRLLGRSEKEVRQEILQVLLTVTAVFVLAGMLLGAALFDRVSQTVLTAEVSLDWMALVLCAVIQMLLLTVASAATANRTAAKHLMDPGKKKRR